MPDGSQYFLFQVFRSRVHVYACRSKTRSSHRLITFNIDKLKFRLDTKTTLTWARRQYFCRARVEAGLITKMFVVHEPELGLTHTKYFELEPRLADTKLSKTESDAEPGIDSERLGFDSNRARDSPVSD